MPDDPTAPPGPPQGPPAGLGKLFALIARLRAPDGCPWDREQELSDLRAYLLEEAHETAAAIDAGDHQALASELGDLLFQIVFILQIAREEGAFEPQEVIERIHDKMVERHPHVFGDEEAADAAAVRGAWERRKAAQKGREASLLDGVAASLPALLAAYRMTQKAAGVGFDWSEPAAVLAKVREELDEAEEALGGGDREHLEEEIGDLLFAIANLARKLGIDPEAALAGTNEKFRQRFRAIETGLAERGRQLGQASLEEMDELWEAAKGGTERSRRG